MNWSAINAIADAASAVAIVVTLIYLALQVRHLKRQSMLASFQHVDNAISHFDDLIAQSAELASIYLRGRESLARLDAEERVRFEHLMGRLLNIVESWHFQITQTADSAPYREEQIRNIAEFVRMRCDHPGVLEFWDSYGRLYNASVHELFRLNTRAQPETPPPDAGRPAEA